MVIELKISTIIVEWRLTHISEVKTFLESMSTGQFPCHQQGFHCVANPKSGRTAQPRTQCTAEFKIVWLLFLNCCILTMLTSPLRFALHSFYGWRVDYYPYVIQLGHTEMASWVTIRYRLHLKDLLKMASLFFLIPPVSKASAEN